MKRKDIFKLIALILLTLAVENLLARGGGGGGHGGGGSHGGGGGHGSSGVGGYHGYGNGQTSIWDFVVFWGFIVFGSFTGITATLLVWKSNISKRILSKIISSDSFWDFQDMQVNARRTFYNIQDAWENRDIDRVKSYITPELYERYKIMLSEMASRNEKNLISQIDITETKIIGCQSRPK